MELGLNGKTAIVTGSTSGIGLAVAQRLASSGASVTICGRGDRVMAAKSSVQEVAIGDASVLAVRCDLSRHEGINQLFDTATTDLGPPSILINCAGNEPFGTLDSFDEERWRTAVDLKLWGYIKLSRLAFNAMRNAGMSGSIVNVTGSGGMYPQPWYPAGAVVNAALNAFTTSFAHHAAAHNVRVNAVSPHYIDTSRLEGGFAAPAVPGIPNMDEMRESVGMRRHGRPEEVADVVAYMVSERATFLSGAVVTVDGATVGLLAGGSHHYGA